jgi:hypothetical protein
MAVFEGSTAAEVQAAYNDQQLSDSELNSLPRGTDAYMSGFPDLQPNNPGAKRMETFKLNVIGPAKIYTSPFGVGRWVQTTMLKMEPNEDGAFCSPGNSGAVTVVPQVHGNQIIYKLLGVNSGNDDFRTNGIYNTPGGYYGPDVRKERAAQFGYPLDDVNIACYQAPKPPVGEVINLVTSADQIPH